MPSGNSDRLLNHMTKVAAKMTDDTASRTLKPRDSATLVILDRSSRAPKVLMGRRHVNQSFMPGKFVFPGGSVEPSDRRMPVAGALSTRAEDALFKKVSRPSYTRNRALALSAIRETYEETGLMIGTKQYGAPEAPENSLWQAFGKAGIYPDIEQLSFVARAITPPGLIRRFDTRFFAVDRKAVAEEQGGFVGPDSELTELIWISLKEANDLEMAPVTRTIIDELRQRIANGMSELLPVPFYHVRYGKAVRETL